MNTPTPASLIGKTLRWSFDSGPTLGKTFEHVFDADGGVTYSVLGADGKPGKPTHEQPAGVEKVGQTVYAVSYLGGSGYTLTVVLNFADMSVVSFASNEKGWFPARGRFELLN